MLYDTRVTHACTRTHKGKGHMEGVCCMIRESHMYVHVHIRVRGTWRVCVVMIHESHAHVHIHIMVKVQGLLWFVFWVSL